MGFQFAFCTDIDLEGALYRLPVQRWTSRKHETQSRRRTDCRVFLSQNTADSFRPPATSYRDDVLMCFMRKIGAGLKNSAHHQSSFSMDCCSCEKSSRLAGTLLRRVATTDRVC